MIRKRAAVIDLTLGAGGVLLWATLGGCGSERGGHDPAKADAAAPDGGPDAAQPQCGDGVCDPGEDCASCADDCGQCPGCGDGVCDPATGESILACPVDCGPCRDRTTVTVSGSTVADIQDAIDQASPGEAVRIPAGSYDCTEPIDVSTADLCIYGDGVDPRDPTAGTHLRTSRSGYGAAIMSIFAAGVRVSSIAFEGHELPPRGTVPGDIRDWNSIGLEVNDAQGVRIDHCYFTSCGYTGVGVWGASDETLVDHNWFVDNYLQGLGYGIAIYEGGSSYQGSRSFVEDSYFSGNRHDITAGHFGYYVARHNHCASDDASNVDCHGPRTTGMEPTYGAEIYDNHIEHATYGSYGILMRGVESEVKIFRNTIVHMPTAIRFTVFTDVDEYDPGPDIYYVWDNTLVDVGSLLSVDSSNATWDIREQAPAGYEPDVYPHPSNDDPCQAGSGGDFLCP